VSAITVILTSAGILALDRVTKHLAEAALTPGVSVPVFENVFHLTLVHNRGAAFGLLPDAAYFFIAVACVSIAAVAVAFTRPRLLERAFGLRPADPRVACALALILGGTIGNLIDRLRHGYVTDFLDLRVWPVFNFADTAISCGAALIVIALVRQIRSPHGPDTL